MYQLSPPAHTTDPDDYNRVLHPDDTTHIQSRLQQLASWLKNEPQDDDCRLKKIMYCHREKIGFKEAGCYSYVPKMILEGMWLHNAGFIMGNYSRIYSLDKVLVICMDERHPKSAPMINLYNNCQP